MSKGFPNNFLWGAATSAYQVEGAAYEGGKKASQQDIINKENYTKRGFATADIASDQYHHYKEDAHEGNGLYDLPFLHCLVTRIS